MPIYDSTMADRFTQLLDTRARALQALLRHDLQAVGTADAREVTDFKDAADDEAQALVDEAQCAAAAAELGQVEAARRRLLDGTYGRCLDCGESIELGRLLALPASPLCTACQVSHEQAGRAAASR